ncbi:MAG: hypothetical protein KatS3mg113_0147 [Planctomycetaceae bacterium]|nr:MAG: hypothetical protein KatS3mg113_0147 [Planctomycetaceae bacterium]
MYGELIPLGGGDPIPLLKPRLLVGRRPSCDITLDFPNVSSHHCEMELINGYWRLRNLSNTNGTKVNGERITEKFVQPGDTISFAKHQYEIVYTPDPTAGPPPEEENPFSRSLLEKAGLSRGDSYPRRPRQEVPRPTVKPPQTDPAKMDEHDLALMWLAEAEQQPSAPADTADKTSNPTSPRRATHDTR